jgi:hypothetical protein
VIDDAAIPAVVDAARGVAFGAVVLAQGERGSCDAEDGEQGENVLDGLLLFLIGFLIGHSVFHE